MSFDIRTLSIITALSAVVFAFAMVSLARLVPGERYLRTWAIGTSMAALSTFLVGLRGVVPDWISIVVANTFLALAFICLYRGTRELVGRAPPGRAWWLIAVFTGIGMAWFSEVQPSVPARVLIASLALVPLLSLISWEFWYYDRQTGPSPLRMANYITVFTLSLGVLIFVGRVVPAFANQGITNYTNSSSALLVAPYLWAILFNVWLAIMVTLTVSARLLSDLAIARDMAQEHSMAKSQFLANMSHEIRTPMNAILGMLQLLKGTDLSTHQQDYRSKTESAARSLLGLLNDILDFSKVEAGKLTLDPQPFSLERLLRDLSVLLSANVGDKNIEVLFDVDATLPPMLVGDAMRLQQVLLNLGGNAIKFTDQGQVIIAIRSQGRQGMAERLVFSVQDSGIGIAPEHMAHIFTGFSQAESSTTRRFGGTGLGLAICQRLVGLMGGVLQLSSVAGEGSTFSFCLDFPLAADTQKTAVSMATGSLAPRSVLLIGGNAVATEITARMTRSCGWTTTVAHSGEQALALVQAHTKDEPETFPFQVIYLNWQLPGMDGWETARQLRQLAQPCTGPAPVLVMVTGHNRAALAQRSTQDQALLNGVLVQPVTTSMLIEAVQELSTAPSRLRQAERGESDTRRLNGLHVLVVEDNLINQQVAKGLLRAEGAVVTVAANGQLGVDAVAAANPPFDVVLMDIQMPVMDGYEATRAIRNQLGLADLPIIAMTANAMASDREACLAAGMNDHIGKPFDLAQLVALLHQWGPSRPTV